jgi:hypothetical protein
MKAQKNYKNGGKVGDPKKKRKYKPLVDPNSKKYPAIAAAEARIRKMREDDKSTRGKAALSSRDVSDRQEAVEGRSKWADTHDRKGRRLAPATLTPKGPLNKGSRFDTAKERKDPNWREQRYTVPNESKDKSLKGRTSGKSGNVGQGVQVKKKRRR